MLLKRAIAIIIDSISVGIIGGIIQAVLGQELGSLATLIIGIGYQVVLLTQNNGKTLGKQLMGIKVVTLDGGTPNALQAGLYYIGYLLNTLVIFIGWILAIASGRGFQNILTGTKVVEA